MIELVMMKTDPSYKGFTLRNLQEYEKFETIEKAAAYLNGFREKVIENLSREEF